MSDTESVPRTSYIEYGNLVIEYHETRHQAVGEAAIEARNAPIRIADEIEHRRDERRRKKILNRCSQVSPVYRSGSR
jgi:hypothetical protein